MSDYTEIKASELKTGMKFWDGSLIAVESDTKCFINIILSDETGLSVDRKWKKSSMIKVK